MIFVTTGSQKFQFNRLLKELDRLIENGTIQEELFAQIGNSDYVPQHYSYSKFLDRDEFAKHIDECSLVITHGGTGVIIGAVKRGKRVIAIPRLAKYGEHVDDHQIQLLTQFDEANIICSCYQLEELEDKIKNIYNMQFEPYVSNTVNIINDIENFLLGE